MENKKVYHVYLPIMESDYDPWGDNTPKSLGHYDTAEKALDVIVEHRATAEIIVLNKEEREEKMEKIREERRKMRKKNEEAEKRRRERAEKRKERKEQLNCQKCNSPDTKESKPTFLNNSIFVRITCKDCGFELWEQYFMINVLTKEDILEYRELYCNDSCSIALSDNCEDCPLHNL